MSALDLTTQAASVLDAFRKRGLKLAMAESCTGGLIAGYLTDVPGSSQVVERGFVTYSNAAKTEMLGVSASLILEAGAVSEAVAVAMAEGGLAHSQADVCVSVTGIAGPDGGSLEKPVGLVHLACARREAETVRIHHVFTGDRTAVRRQSVAAALSLLEQAAGK